MTIMENREKWATALESGEFHQVQAKIVDGGFGHPVDPSVGMCCLGVAQYLFEKHMFTAPQHTQVEAGLGAMCSNNVRELLGLEKTDCNLFMDFNDNLDYSFPQIAAEVRALPPVAG